MREPLLSAAAWYFLHGRNSRNLPVDAVARFHLGNGARLERLDWLGDTSERALAQSHGLMVNYPMNSITSSRTTKLMRNSKLWLRPAR